MAVNDIYFFTIGYTSNGEGSLKPNVPIKQKYRQTINTTAPLFPEAYELVSSQKYWFPFESITVNDTDYYEYVDGDEFTFDDSAPVRSIPTSAPATKVQKYSDYQAGTRVIYANEIYEATDFYFNWSDTGFGEQSNPYSSNSVRKWRVIEDTTSEWTPFWYDPRSLRFYPLPNTIQLQSVAVINEVISDRWQLFTGDSDGMDLSTLSSRKVEELVSVGFSQNAAESTVSAEEQAVISAIYGTGQASQVNVLASQAGLSTLSVKGVENGAPRVSTSTVVRFSSSGAEGEAGNGGSDRPQMIQYFKNSDGTSAEIPARFEFAYRPNSVNYSNIGSEWTEISRVNNSPILDFRSFRLMKISFEFLVGDNNNIFTSCDDQLRVLRTMALRPFPVVFLGFDAMFSEQLTYPAFTGGSGIEFAIVDMSITSVQRARADAGISGQTPTGEINRATVSLTLQELPIETQTLIQLPKLPPDKPPRPRKERDVEQDCVNRFSKVFYNSGPFPVDQYESYRKTNCVPPTR